MSMITALQIEDWFKPESRRTWALLIQLARELITETIPKEHIVELRIPVADEIGLPGFDGVVVTNMGGLNVPEGRSVWEASTSDDPARMFRTNYEKRNEYPFRSKSVFIFVTPHKWESLPTLERLLEEYRERDEWRDVWVIDRTRLENWLSVSPFTASWLLREFTGHAGPIRSCDIYFKEELQGKYCASLQPAAIVAGRESNTEEIRTWVGTDSQQLRVIGESAEEACAFIASVVLTSSNSDGCSMRDSLAFVESVDALHHLKPRELPYILVVLDEDVRSKATQLQEKGLRIIIPLARRERHPTARSGVVILEHMHRLELEAALEEMDVPTPKAREIARECKGSFAGFLWQVSEQHEPIAWTHGDAVAELVPILLAGQWNVNNEYDQQIIELLSGRDYDSVRASIARWQYPDGPLLRRGPLVDWLAWPFAMSRLAQFVDEVAIKRFAQVVRRVLSEVDPSLELPPDERWLANLKGKVICHSEALRSGLAAALALLAVNGDQIRGTNGQVVADSLVDELLSIDKEAPTRWYSLASYLPELAEAAPEVFLKRVGKLTHEQPSLATIFEEEGYFGSSRHVHLLWALERVAWSEEHFPDAVLLLGDLAAVDPGGTVSNRPANTLVEIFLPWGSPHTSAHIHKRLGALDALKSRQPDIAWSLSVALFHRVTQISSPTAKPRFRDWADEAKSLTSVDYREFMLELTKRLVSWVADKPLRWTDLISNIDKCRDIPELYNPLLSALQALDASQLDDSAQQSIADTLRDFIHRHRSYPDSDWALKEEQLARFDEILKRLEPEDPIARNLWLFGGWPDIPQLRNMDLDKRFAELQSLRTVALQAVYREQGILGIMKMLRKCENLSDAGRALAHLDMSKGDEQDFLRTSLGLDFRETDEEVPPLLKAAWAFVSERYRHGGSVWLEEAVLSRLVTDDQVFLSNLALALPAIGNTWDLIDSWGSSVAEKYWRRTSVSMLQDPSADGERAVEQLLRVERPYRVLEIVANAESPDPKKAEATGPRVFSSATVRKILSVLPNHLPSDELYGPNTNIVSYYITNLFALLDQAGIESEQLIPLEFALLPLLEHGERGPRAIREAIRDNAQVFVDLICLAYRAEDEEVSPESKDQRIMRAASFAHRILDSFKQVPGADYTGESGKEFEGDISFAEGTMNAKQLRVWVEVARKKSHEEKRLGVCDLLIGELLAYSPATGGIWPCESVCELIEGLASDDIEQGLGIGVFNKRGVYSMGHGGEQERKLAKKFGRFAEKMSLKWRRTRAVLREIARQLEGMAVEEDRRAEFQEFE